MAGSTITVKVTTDTTLGDYLRDHEMSIQQTSSWRDFAVLEPQVAWKRRHPRAPKSARYIVFGIIGTFAAISSPTLLALLGIGMSRQDADIAANAAFASLLAIVISFAII